MNIMKITPALLLLNIFSASAFAGAAVSYSCVGKDAVSKQAIVFNLVFSDYDPSAGYTNQSVTVTKKGWHQLEEPDVLQMFEATQENNCQENAMGERYFADEFEMAPADGDVADYLVTFKSQCGENKNYDVKGYCFFEY